jgi:hypothetical protein
MKVLKTVDWFEEDERRKRVDERVNATMEGLLAAYGVE